MAYDKVIDSAQLETAITATANAIREKTGGTESLEWLADKGFADIVSAIESDGGKILGHSFASGSFTLAEEQTETYNVLTQTELFELFKDEFTDAINFNSTFFVKDSTTDKASLYNFLIGICWIDNTASFKTTYQNKQFLAGFLPRTSINSSNCIVAYADSYGNFAGKNGSSSTAKIVLNYTGFSIQFHTSQMGFAGTKYNWLIVALDHGEWAGY